MAWYWIVLICLVTYFFIGLLVLTVEYFLVDEDERPPQSAEYTYDMITVALWPVAVVVYLVRAPRAIYYGYPAWKQRREDRKAEKSVRKAIMQAR